MGKTIWITGASSGIGQATSIVYNRNGFHVILSGRNYESLAKTRSLLANPEKSTILPFDVTDKVATDDAIKFLKDQNLLPDYYFLNAGVSQRSLAEDTDFEVTSHIINTNLMSNLYITKQCIAWIKSKKAHIIVISSVAGKIGSPYRTAYAASKHALHGYYDSLRAELFEHGAKVTIVCPGYITTNISINALRGDGSVQKSMDKQSSNGLSPKYLANAIYIAVSKNKSEIYVGKKEILAIYIKRFFPTFLERIIRGIKPS